MATTNRQVRLGARPVGLPKPDDWQHTTEDVPEPGDGEFLVRTEYISLDPAMRGWMNDARSYIRPVRIGEIMRAAALGSVIASNHPGFAVGDHVTGTFGVQEYAVSDGRGVIKADPAVAPLPTYLGVLGLTGLTAYFGLLDIGRPKEGETVVVSGAAGAVGSIVCQIAKFKNCRVVGVAGSDEKCEYVTNELGADACVNYKATGDLNEAVRAACPAGVDVYFDNVGGAISDAVMWLINPRARVAVCGQISMYNSERWETGPRVQPLLLVKSALMQGFIVSDYAARFGEGLQQLGAWVAEGKLKYAESIVEGFENAPRAFLGLFAGENTGKQLVKVADPSASR